MSNENRFEMIMVSIYEENLQDLFFKTYDQIKRKTYNLTHHEISDMVFIQLNKDHQFLT